MPSPSSVGPELSSATSTEEATTTGEAVGAAVMRVRKVEEVRKKVRKLVGSCMFAVD